MPISPEHDEISARRATIRDELIRANRAAIGIFVAVVLLAAAIVFAAHKAQQHAAEALKAGASAQRELWRSQVAEARATRQSVAMGRRVDAWRAITNAAAFERNLELRNEAVAALAIPDIRQLTIPESFVPFKQFATFDTSGKRYMVSSNGVVTMHNADNGSVIWTAPAAEGKRWFDMAWAHTNRWGLTPHSDGSAALWDLSGPTKVKEFKASEFTSYSFSGDDHFLALSFSDGAAHFFELPSVKEVSQIRGFSANDDMALNQDGSRVVTWSRASRQVRIIDRADPSRVVTITTPAPPFVVEWHPDMSQIACANGDHRIRIYDARSGEELQTLSGHNAQPVDLRFVAGRPWLLSMSWDGTARLWDTVSAEELVRIPRYGDGTFLDSETRQFGWRVQNNSVLERFQIETPTVVRTLPDAVQPASRRPYKAAFSPDDRTVAAAYPDGIRFIEAATGRILSFMPMPGAWELDFATNGSLRFISQRKIFELNPADTTAAELDGLAGDKIRLAANTDAFAVLDGQKLKIWRAGKTLEWTANQEGLDTIAISPDARWLATGTRNHVGLRLWDASNGKLVWTNDFRQGAGVAFSADASSLFVAGTEGCAKFEVMTGHRTWLHPHDEGTSMNISIATSPNGQLVAVANTPTQAMLIDAQTGAEIAKLTAPNPRYINLLTFSPSSSRVAVGFEDRSIQLWDLRRLNTDLAEIGLSWQQPALKAPPSQTPERLMRNLLILAAGGVVAAIVFGMFVFARHRQLLRGYLELEALAVQRQDQLRIAENELARGQKMTALGALAAGVAHDFNNLLSVIRMANTGIARVTRRPPDIADDLQDIESAVVDGKRIVQSMLGYTRDGLGPVETFDLGAVLEETTRLLSRQYLTGLQVHVQIEPDLPRVTGYPGRLRQMLLNLVVNASEAMNGKGELWIEASRTSLLGLGLVLRPTQAENYICITVRDSGPGIDPQHRARIFEPFFTTKTSATVRGTGLGLSLVYTMAEHDRLGLNCESAPGQGATFTIIFPVHATTGSLSPMSGAQP